MADFDLLDAATGQPVRVSADEAEAGLREGRLRAGRPLPALDPRGQAGELAPEGISAALSRGYRLDTPEARARREYQAEHPIEAGVVHPTVTAASGVLRGATLGASQLGEEALGIREEIQRLREENPTAATIGDVAGIALPALETGGAALVGEGGAAGAAARGILAPGRTAMRIGEHAGTALTRTLAGGAESGIARRVLARVAGGAAEGAIQTGLTEGGEIATEQALGEDSGDIADRLITATGLGAILGGGLHGGGGILGEAARVGARRSRALGELLARQYAESTGRALPRGMDELLAEIVSRGSGVVRGESPTLARRFLGADGREALRVLEQGEGAIDQASAGLRGSIDRMLGRAGHVSEEMLGEAKVGSLERVMGGDLVQQRATAQSMLERAERLHAELSADLDAYQGVTYGRSAGSARRRLDAFVRRARDRVEAAVSASGSDARRGAEMFSALDQLKRDVGGIRREMERGGGTTFGRDAFNGLYQDLRSPLESADVWGDGVAALQRESNQGWVNFIPWDNDVDRMLLRAGRPIDGDFGRATMADSAAVRNFVAALGQERNASSEAVFRNWLDGLEQRNAAALEHHELSGAARADAEALHAEIRGVREQLANAQRTAETLEAGRALGRGNAGIAGVAATVAGATGSIGLAAPLAAFAALSNPLRIAHTLAAVHRLAGQSDGAITRAVRGFLTTGRRAARVAVGEGGRAARAAVTVGSYRERLAQLDRDRDASQLATRVASSTRDLAHAAPRLHGVVASRAARAVSFLQGVRPRGAAAGMFPAARRDAPSRTEQERFMRYARAVDDPSSVLDDLADGRATREGIEALRAVYPSLYQRMVRAVMEELAQSDEQPSYQHRLQLGLLMGAPVDPTMRPEFLSMLQSALVQEASPQPQATQGRAPDLSGQLASDSDRLTARRAS